MNNGILEKNNDFSFVKIMLIFFVLVGCSSLFPLLSKQSKNMLENNRMAQHLLGILTLLSVVILISDGKLSIHRIFAYTIIGYTWFMISTKMDIHFCAITFISLIAFYLYQTIIKRDEEKIMEDINLEDIEKTIIQKRKKDNYIYITLSMIALTICGTLFYSNKKEIQYGGGYNMLNFLLY